MAEEKVTVSPNQMYALVVGIETYQLGAEYDLNGPARDGLRFVEWLLSRGAAPENIRFFVSPLAQNAEVELLALTRGIQPHPATRDRIDAYLRNELITAPMQGNGLYVFWGGHGIITKTNGVTRRLLFADTTAANKLNLDVNSLVQALGTSTYGAGFKRQFFLIDACANSYFQGLYETVQGETAGQRYSATGEQSQSEQFVLFAAGDYEVATNDEAEGAGLFSQAVLTELESQPLMIEDVKAFAEGVQATLRSWQKIEPYYWWYRGKRGDTTSERQAAPVALSRTHQLEISRMQTEIEDLEQDYETISAQLRSELDGSTQNKMKRQLEAVNLEIDSRENRLSRLRQGNG